MGIVIKVENLGKKYIISHQQERYTALRDVMVNSAKTAAKTIIGKKTLLPKKEEFWALRNIDFEVNAGDRIGIIGRNGAGKSTLLKLLSRITEPTTGKIKIKGKIASLLEVGTGFHNELTGKENILLNGAILGMSKKEILKKMDDIVEFSGVEKFLDTPVKRYSSGMYVRLAFAVAAHLETEILLIDEVLAVGDAEFQKKCLGKMEDVSKKEGRTVLFVSHNLTAIRQLCTRTILLSSGNILVDRSTQETLNAYTSMSPVDRNNGNLTNPMLRSSKSNPNSLIKWTYIRLLNSLGESARDVFYHEPFDLVFQGGSVRKCEDILIGLAITSKLNGLIFTTHQAYNGLSTNIPEGLLEFRVNINPNLLAPGRYEVEIAAEGPGVGDWIPIAVEFSVLEVGITPAYNWYLPGRNGIIDYPCKWDLEILSNLKHQC